MARSTSTTPFGWPRPPAAGGKGVLLATNQEVHAARDVMKTNANRVDAFQSVDLGLIGVADPDTVKFFAEPTRRHTHRSEFDLSALPESLPAVEIVTAYPDAPGRVIDELVAAGAKGLVVDGAGPDSLSGGQLEAVRRAQEKGVVVVATAPTRGGPRAGHGFHPRVRNHPRRQFASRKGADPAPAGADEDDRPRRDQADLRRVLAFSGPRRTAGPPDREEP